MAQPEKPEYVLFLMNNCNFCSNFITKLKTKKELLAKFNIVNVEEIPVIPDEVSEVPCVYDGKNVFLGKDSFKWLNEKLSDFLLPADNSLSYSFINGEEEEIFSNYSLINQLNGSSGIGDSKITNKDQDRADATRITHKDVSSKAMTLESLMANRESEIKFN